MRRPSGTSVFSAVIPSRLSRSHTPGHRQDGPFRPPQTQSVISAREAWSRVPPPHAGLNHREHGGRRGLTASTRRSQSRSPGIGRMGALPPPKNRIRISAREAWSRGNHAETLCDLRVLCGDSFPPFPIPYPRASAGWALPPPPNTIRDLGARGVEPRAPTPRRIEPQRTRRTQRVDGIRDTLLVSDWRAPAGWGTLHPPKHNP